MVEIRQRKGPSGPFDGDGGGFVLYAQSIPFGLYTVNNPPNRNTIEQSDDIYFYPVPATGDAGDWSVIANPENDAGGGEAPPDPPFWMPNWSHSHVRISDNDVNMNALDPAIAVGTLGVLVKLGMCFVNDITGPVTIDGLIFDIMFIQQTGTPRTVVIPVVP